MSALLLAPADPGWPALAENAALPLRALFPGAVLEHIGSTAVARLCAKPVLDLMLGLRHPDQALAQRAALAALGYRYRPEHEAALPERRYFTRDADARSLRVHLHALPLDGPAWRQHLALRDALRGDPALRAAYAALKTRLAAEHADDKAAYQAAKAPFIRRALAALQAQAAGVAGAA